MDFSVINLELVVKRRYGFENCAGPIPRENQAPRCRDPAGGRGANGMVALVTALVLFAFGGLLSCPRARAKSLWRNRW
jgi:hypothetical protein